MDADDRRELDEIRSVVLRHSYELRALQFSLVAAIDEATAGFPDRASLIRAISDALSAPEASYDDKSPQEQAGMLEITSMTALLSDFLVSYCRKRDEERGRS